MHCQKTISVAICSRSNYVLTGLVMPSRETGLGKEQNRVTEKHKGEKANGTGFIP